MNMWSRHPDLPNLIWNKLVNLLSKIPYSILIRKWIHCSKFYLRLDWWLTNIMFLLHFAFLYRENSNSSVIDWFINKRNNVGVESTLLILFAGMRFLPFPEVVLFSLTKLSKCVVDFSNRFIEILQRKTCTCVRCTLNNNWFLIYEKRFFFLVRYRCTILLYVYGNTTITTNFNLHRNACKLHHVYQLYRELKRKRIRG